MNNLVTISCPLCGKPHNTLWATENGFKCVRCDHCKLLYVNPRPDVKYIKESVKLGSHVLADETQLNTKTRRIHFKQKHSERMIKKLFTDIFDESSIKWLDVGAGYGEFIQALISVLPAGSKVEGLEPMIHKAEKAKKLNLPIKQGYLDDVTEHYDIVSIIDVFSHIPEFSGFLSDIKKVLNSQGEVLIKTGNAADIGKRSNFPGLLNLPDHLVFGGVPQLTLFLEKAGFSIIGMKSERIDGFWYSLKNIAKYFLGKPVSLSVPYMSPSRTIWIRARLNY